MLAGISQNFWVNLIGFQLIWFLCVMFGNTWLFVVVFLLCCHIFFHRQPKVESYTIFICAMIGYGIDTLLTMKGIFIFPNDPVFPPIWLFILWLSFSATLTQSLGFFADHYGLAAIFGAFGGSGAYLTAETFGQFTLGLSFWYSGLLMALIWAVLFPSLILLSHSIKYLQSKKQRAPKVVTSDGVKNESL